MLNNPAREPIDYICPHCESAAAKLMPTVGDFAEIHCPTCGDYRISGTEQVIFERGAPSARDGHFRIDSNGNSLARIVGRQDREPAASRAKVRSLAAGQQERQRASSRYR